MAVVRGYGQNGTKFNSNVTIPQSTFLNFTVTPTNGLGVTSVKSNGYVNYCFMHTSTTPTATGGVTNPNPPVGYAMIGLKNNFSHYLGLRWQIDYPATSTGTTSTTANSVYTITALGTATAAQWQAVGLPAWLTPTVGQTFVATASQSIGGSATVGVPGVPNISAVSVVGDPDQTIASSNIAQYGGAYLLLQFAGFGGAFTGTALSAHSHDFLVKGGQAASTTNDVAMYSGPLIGKEQASDATVVGGSSTNGGVQTASAGTPAGTIAMTGAAAAPTTAAIVRLELFYDASSVTIDGL